MTRISAEQMTKTTTTTSVVVATRIRRVNEFVIEMRYGAVIERQVRDEFGRQWQLIQMFAVHVTQYDAATQLFQRHGAHVGQRVELNDSRIQRGLNVLENSYRRGAIA